MVSYISLYPGPKYVKSAKIRLLSELSWSSFQVVTQLFEKQVFARLGNNPQYLNYNTICSKNIRVIPTGLYFLSSK